MSYGRSPTPDAPFRGSLIDEKMFAIDVAEWGFANLLAEMRKQRRNPEVEDGWQRVPASRTSAA